MYSLSLSNKHYCSSFFLLLFFLEETNIPIIAAIRIRTGISPKIMAKTAQGKPLITIGTP